MKTINISLVMLGLLAAMAFGSGSAKAEEYMYRDIMGNTLPSQKCLNRQEAEGNATDAYLLKKKEKVFCETQGYGWHVAEEKGNGKLVCQECPGDTGKYQCHLEDLVVACKRLKPGSVGLIPGKG